MVKKAQKNHSKVHKSKKILIKNSLFLISPFYFTKKNSFIYNIKFYKDYKKYVNSYDKFKLTEDEYFFLNFNINSIQNSFTFLDSKNSSDLVIDYLQKIFPYIKKVEENKSKTQDIIEEIMNNRRKQDNISLLKIKEILNKKYNINIGRTTIYRILKFKLKYRFRKTIIKNKDLDELKYKIISFIFIKIIIRAMKLNMNFVFIDESNFSLINNHYKTWIKDDETLHFGPKMKNKFNIILAISINKVINYEITNENINKNNFAKFLENTINKMNIEELNNTIFIMDNLSVHCCKKLIRIMKRKKLKVLFTVPYESCFNPIELAFRYIKNKTYKKIYLKIKDLKKDVIELLKLKYTEEVLFKNFIETLRKYESFIIKNKFIKLDDIQQNE
jgi:transposase